MLADRIAFGLTALAVCGLVGCGSSGTPAQQADGLVTSGLTAQLSGDLATAENDYNQALQLDPSNKYAHYDLGTIDDKQGNPTQAVVEYRATLAIDPNFTSALYNLAVDTATADPNGAAQLYRKVIALDPSSAGAWLNLGFVMMTEGNPTEAKADWAQATSLNPSLASRIPTASPSAASTASPAVSPTPK